LYAGKAWLQIARQLQKMDEPEEQAEAERVLKRIIDTNEMDDLVKALAWLELAAIAKDRGEQDQVRTAVDQAAAIRNNRLSDADDEIFLRSVPESLRQLFSSERAPRTT
jgi:predicted negative regulator of RcsB-dependent stress response